LQQASYHKVHSRSSKMMQFD